MRWLRIIRLMLGIPRVRRRWDDAESVLQQSDVIKVDFGVQVAGRICDSAFTMNFEPTWNRLLEAVKDATDAGVRVSRHMAALTFRLLGWM